MSSVILGQLRGFAMSRWQKLLRQFDDLDALRQRLDYQTYILAACGLISSLVLGFGDLATKSSIAARLEEDIQATLEQVLPSTLHDNALLQDVKTISDNGEAKTVYIARQQGVVTAVAFKFIANGGYSGPISLMMGVDKNGSVLGVRVIAHAETPGLGDKIEVSKSNWILSFNGRSLENTLPERWRVKKDSGDFDQFAGATITPRAVVRGVEAGLKFFRQHREELLR
jgi:electron transport complex protein RnfG